MPEDCGGPSQNLLVLFHTRYRKRWLKPSTSSIHVPVMLTPGQARRLRGQIAEVVVMLNVIIGRWRPLRVSCPAG
jgi:hypothetical protein